MIEGFRSSPLEVTAPGAHSAVGINASKPKNAVADIGRRSKNTPGVISPSHIPLVPGVSFLFSAGTGRVGSLC